MMEELFLFTFILITGIAGYMLKALTLSGAFSAVLVGMAVSAGLGVKGLFLLGVFFVTSSMWSSYKRSFKTSMEEKLAKGATRDYRQVLANGGAAALFSLISYFRSDPIWTIGFAVCLAGANSDTWASEIGSLSRKNPIYIRTFKPVERGTSGAISLLGTAAALAGSLVIGFITMWLFRFQFSIGLLVFLFGFFGNVLDTVMGAFYQQVFICNKCGLETEKRAHCGQPTIRIKGISFVDNDMVNFLSGLCAAIFAVCLVFLISNK